jgi:hypothetical protein
VCADAIGAAIPTETTNRPASNSLKRVIGFIPFSTRGGRKRESRNNYLRVPETRFGVSERGVGRIVGCLSHASTGCFDTSSD